MQACSQIRSLGQKCQRDEQFLICADFLQSRIFSGNFDNDVILGFLMKNPHFAR